MWYACLTDRGLCGLAIWDAYWVIGHSTLGLVWTAMIDKHRMEPLLPFS